MKRPTPYPYYTIWRGALNLGDTPGVYMDSTFVGLMVHIPINISFITAGKPFLEVMLFTEEVEIFNNNTHPVYFDWEPGTSFPNPVGQIDDIDIIPNMPEYHLLKISTQGLALGNHSLTIVVNNKTPMGLEDDFVLRSIDADNDTGMKIGWI